MENFSEWLVHVLKERDMTQADLSRLSGVTNAQISRVINGTRGIGPDALTAIAHALKLPQDLVFEKAGIFPHKTELSSVKRTAIGLIEIMSEEDAAFIETFLRSYAQNKK